MSKHILISVILLLTIISMVPLATPQLLMSNLYIEPLSGIGSSRNIAVVIDCDILREIPGGVAAVSIVVPLRGEPISEHSIVSSKRCPAAVLFDGRRVVEKWSSRNTTNLPTLNIRVISSAPNHFLCFSNLMYSSVDYFKDRGYGLVKAYEEAEKDPVALFRYGAIIRLSSRNSFISCVNISGVISEIESLVSRSKSSISGSAADHASMAKAYSKEISLAGTCTPSTRIWWSDLYNEQNNPPREWLQRIAYAQRGTPDEYHAGQAWNMFARHFSIEWVYPSSCTYEEAKNDFYNNILPNAYPPLGVNYMDELVWRYIDQYHYWEDKMRGVILDTIFGIGLQVINNYHKKYYESLSFFAGQYTENRIGITILGVIFLGFSEPKTNMGMESEGITPGYTSAKLWIYFPTRLIGLGDGYVFFIDEYKECIDPTWCNYIFRPVVTFIPIYEANNNYSATQITNILPIDAQDPVNLSDLGAGLTWKLLNTTINPPCGVRFYTDTNIRNDVYSRDYGAIITSISQTLLGPILAIYLSKLASVFASVAMGMVSFTWAIYGQTFVGEQLIIQSDLGCEPATIKIYKYSMRYINNTFYTAINNVPFMIYRIEIE
ncbi:MAG: hypothetical protein ACP5GI_06770 [Sulfolobales archaeon]